MEDLLKETEDGDRLCLFPIKNADLYELWEKSLELFWTHHEVKLSGKDRTDFDNIDPLFRKYLLNILAFFANSDNIVLENVQQRFNVEIKDPSARLFLGHQASVEALHNVVYNQLIETLVRNETEKKKTFTAVRSSNVVGEKLDWALKWIGGTEANAPFAQRVVAWSIVEAIFFSSSFASIFWLRSRNICPGLCFANQKIADDENMHVQFSCHLYRHHIQSKLTEEKVTNMIKDAVDIETNFIKNSFPGGVVQGLTVEDLISYTKHVANGLFEMLGYSKVIYPNAKTIEYMRNLAMETRTNFFESTVKEYKVCNIDAAEVTLDGSLDF